MPSTGAKKVGGAFVEVFADNSRLVRGLKTASAKLKTWGKSVTKMGTKIFAAGGAALGASLGSAKQFMAAGDALDKMSIRVGASVEFLGALSHAAKIGGTDISAMEVGIRRLQRTTYDASRGLTTAMEAFSDLGIEIRQQDGRLKSTEQLFMEAATALSKIENNTHKAALATIIFGRAGTLLLPMLRDGKDGLVAVMEEAKELGIVMSTEDTTAAAEMTDAWTRLSSVLKMSAIRIGGALAPALTELAERAAKVIRPVIDWIRNNGQLLLSIMKIAAVVMGAGLAFIILGKTILGLGVIFTGLVTTVTTVGTALGTLSTILGALVTPIGLVSAALVALGGYLIYASGVGDQALTWLGDKFNSLKDTALAAWQGIADALASGDIGLAAEILWLTLKMEWQKGINWLKEKWIAFKGSFIEIFQKAVFGIARYMTEAWAGLQIAWVEITSFIGNNWNRLISSLKKAWNHFSGFFKKVWAKVKDLVGLGDDDAEAEIARINEEVAKKDQEIEREKQEKIGERKQERINKLIEIEQQRQGAQEELDKMQAEEQADRAKKHQDELKKSEKKLAEARKKWEEALAKAARNREQIGDAKGPPRTGFMSDLPSFEGMDLEAETQKFSVRGTFSALAVAGLGSGLTERIAKNTEAMDKKLGVLVNKAKDGALVFD